MNNFFTGIVCSMIFLCTAVHSQNVAINITGAVANTSAMLDIDATNKGLLIPRVALTATNSNAPVGATVVTSLMVYNTATAGAGATAVTPGYYWWNGTQWDRFLNTNSAWQIGGNYLGGTSTGYIFGPMTNDHIDFYTNGAFRARWLNNGDFAIGNTTYIAPAITGDKLGVFVTASTNSWAINGVNTSGTGGSIYADNTSAANGYNALEAIQNGSYAGVFGLHITNSAGYGVVGQTNRANNQWGLYTEDNTFSLGYFVPSDEKLKTNITPINNALNAIDKLTPVTYNWNMDKYPSFGFDPRVVNYGLLAQDLQQVYPDMVAVNSFSAPVSNPVQARQSNANAKYEFSSVNYTALVPVLIQAIKELNTGMKELTNENQELTDRLQKIEAQMLQLQK